MQKKPASDSRFRFRPSFILLVFILVGCASSAGQDGVDLQTNHAFFLTEPASLEPVLLGEGEPLEIVASTSIIADIVSNIGGERVNLTGLMPRGIDPHAYQPTPGDLQALYQADAILLNGLDLELDLEDVLAPASLEVPVISLSTNQQARTLESDRHEEGETHEGGMDPHIWFDPLLVITWVDRIETTLSRLDPASTDAYQERAAAYRSELLSLDVWIRQQVESIPAEHRILVLDHLVLGYFSDRYGFSMGGALAPAFSSVAEASPRELSALTEIIQREGIKVIFIGVGTNPRLAEQIAADAGIDVVQLYTGSLGPADGSAGTYLDMMQYNVLAITQALTP